MAKDLKKEVAVIDFTKFSVAQLPELKGKKEEIESVIKANPVIEIIDNPTYELAKKGRTTVKTLCVGLEGEQKTVKKRIKEFVLDVVDKEYDTLVLGARSALKLRQEPIDIWEAKKEEERLEKVRLEELRIKNIKDAIQTFKDAWIDNVNHLHFEGIAGFEEMLEKFSSEFDREKLAEFEILFDDALLVIRQFADAKIQTLTEQEQIRLDNIIIEEQRAENRKIMSWQLTWNSNIDALTFEEIAEVKKTFKESKLVYLKHYSIEYDETFTSTEKRLHSQIEFVSKAEEQRIAKEKFDAEQKILAENQRIAQEKFKQEKAEFEEKQAEAKFQERCKKFMDLGCVFSEEQKGYEKQGYWIHCDDIKNSSEDMINRELEDCKIAETKVIEVTETTQEVEFEERVFDSEPIVSNIESIVGNRIVQADYHEDDVHEIATAKYIEPEENIHSYEALADYFITVWNKGGAVKVELTFLEKDYDKFKEKSIQEILKVHLPTKKQ